MNRIDQKFQTLKALYKKAFVAFTTAGDPNLKTTVDLVLAFENAGADIVELGVPFSDPLADGPTIQASYDRALKLNVDLPKIFDVVRQIRQSSQIPLCLMSSYNPIFHYGLKRFVADAVKAGVDGVIIPDLPPEEAGELMALCRSVNIATIFFISPTTTKERMKKVAEASTGFIYFVSLTGVTGARKQLAPAYAGQIRLAKSITQKPICIGFGISTPEQVKTASAQADGVIVGSAIVSQIVKSKQQVVKRTATFVKTLTKVLK